MVAVSLFPAATHLSLSHRSVGRPANFADLFLGVHLAFWRSLARQNKLFFFYFLLFFSWKPGLGYSNQH